MRLFTVGCQANEIVRGNECQATRSSHAAVPTNERWQTLQIFYMYTSDWMRVQRLQIRHHLTCYEQLADAHEEGSRFCLLRPQFFRRRKIRFTHVVGVRNRSLAAQTETTEIAGGDCGFGGRRSLICWRYALCFIGFNVPQSPESGSSGLQSLRAPWISPAVRVEKETT